MWNTHTASTSSCSRRRITHKQRHYNRLHRRVTKEKVALQRLINDLWFCFGFWDTHWQWKMTANDAKHKSLIDRRDDAPEREDRLCVSTDICSINRHRSIKTPAVVKTLWIEYTVAPWVTLQMLVQWYCLNCKNIGSPVGGGHGTILTADPAGVEQEVYVVSSPSLHRNSGDGEWPGQQGLLLGQGPTSACQTKSRDVPPLTSVTCCTDSPESSLLNCCCPWLTKLNDI